MRRAVRYFVGATLFVALSASACGESRPAVTSPGLDPDLLSGQYSLALTIDSSCTALPDALHSRTYTSRIDSRVSGDYAVTLGGAAFLENVQVGERGFAINCGGGHDLGCNQFTATRDGDAIRFRLAPNNERLNDEFAGSGGMIVELIPPDAHQLSIDGVGSGLLTGGGAIRAAIDGRVSYCPAKYSSFDEDCATCQMARVEMTFTRR
jgi:hypothetical protein